MRPGARAGAKNTRSAITNVGSSAIDHFTAIAEWYLTVRCTNPTCGNLIAFQKMRFPGSNPDHRLAVIGEVSVDCPRCKTVVRFRQEQIERRQVTLTQ